LLADDLRVLSTDQIIIKVLQSLGEFTIFLGLSKFKLEFVIRYQRNLFFFKLENSKTFCLSLDTDKGSKSLDI